MDDADDDAELVDAELCHAGVCIFSSIAPQMIIYHMEPSSPAGSVLIAIGRDDDRIVRSSRAIHYEYAHTRRPSPAASWVLAAHIG